MLDPLRVVTQCEREKEVGIAIGKRNLKVKILDLFDSDLTEDFLESLANDNNQSGVQAVEDYIKFIAQQIEAL